MKIVYAILFGVLVQINALATVSNLGVSQIDPPHPCAPGSHPTSFNIDNTDDLLFAGQSLDRAGRHEEAVECLNRGKHMASDYLDIRLALINAFAQMGDLVSGDEEAIEFNIDVTLDTFSPDSAKYYRDTYTAYVSKLKRIVQAVKPKPGFRFEPVPFNFRHSQYRSLMGEVIINEDQLQMAVELKFQGQFVQARSQIQPLLISNPNSPTVWFYAGLIDYTLANTARAVTELDEALDLAHNDLDVILSMARAMNADALQKEAYDLLKKEQSLFVNYGCLQLAHAALDAVYSVDPTRASAIENLIVSSLSSQDQGSQICKGLRF